MTAIEINTILEGFYVNPLKSNLIKVKLIGGFMAYGKFLKNLQKADDCIANKWTFTCVGIDILLDGNNIEYIMLVTNKL